MRFLIESWLRGWVSFATAGKLEPLPPRNELAAVLFANVSGIEAAPPKGSFANNSTSAVLWNNAETWPALGPACGGDRVRMHAA